MQWLNWPLRLAFVMRAVVRILTGNPHFRKQKVTDEPSSPSCRHVARPPMAASRAPEIVAEEQ